MADKKEYLSQEGYDALVAELDNLKNVRRAEVSQRIKEATALGDLSENSEYDDAKNEQAFVEGRIAELESKLKVAQIVTARKGNGNIEVGSKVTLLNNATGKQIVYMIIGSSESDPFSGKISNESPIGSALIGHRKGDEVEVETPGGRKSFTVEEVEG